MIKRGSKRSLALSSTHIEDVSVTISRTYDHGSVTVFGSARYYITSVEVPLKRPRDESRVTPRFFANIPISRERPVGREIIDEEKVVIAADTCTAVPYEPSEERFARMSILRYVRRNV